MFVLMKSDMISSFGNSPTKVSKHDKNSISHVKIFLLQCFCFKSRNINGTVNESFMNRSHN